LRVSKLIPRGFGNSNQTNNQPATDQQPTSNQPATY
jgi:hypothetical protein